MKKWEECIRKVTPYTPGEQPKASGVVKLNTNENPYPPAPGVQKVLSGFPAEELRLYPDPASSDLVHALAERNGLSDGQVFVGVGSDDVLAMCFLTFFNSGKPVLFPDITYSFYDVWAELFGIPFERIPLDDAFRIRPEDYFQENGGIVIANPNAPTGIFLELSRVEEILEHNPDVIVIVDEAYVDFGGESVLPLLEKYDNLVVVQTFSKSRSLAGLRIGCAMASGELIRYLNDVKYSYNSYTMNRTVIAAGVASLEDEAYFRETCRRIVETRKRTKAALEELGFACLPSAANFLFAAHRKVPAAALFEKLKARRIFVRYFPKNRIDNYLRITIGTEEEMDQLLQALEEILGEEG